MTNSNYNVYVMNPDGTNIRPLVNGVRESPGVQWSPNNRWLVFYALYQGHTGLWLLDIASNNLRLIAEGIITVYDWSPDGQRLVVISHFGDSKNPRDDLGIIELGSIIH